MVILVILGYGILGLFSLLLLLLLAALILPVRGYSRIQMHDKKVNWMWRVMILFNAFGLIGSSESSPRLLVVGREHRPKSEPQGRAEKTPAKPRKGGKSGAKRSAKPRKRRFPVKLFWRHQDALIRFLKRLVSALHLRMEGDVTLGVEDPAWVGIGSGGFWAIFGEHAHRLQVHWNYVENVCEGQVTLQAHTRLGEILWAAIRLAWELPLRQIWRTFRR